METNLIRYIGMSLEFFAALIMILVLLCCVFEKPKTTLLKIYIFMAVSCVVSLLTEAISIAVYGRQGVDMLLTALNTVSLAGGYSLAFAYACYIVNLVGTEKTDCRLTVKILKSIGVLSAFSLGIGSFFGWHFTVENGIFTPGRYFIGVFAFDILACLAGINLLYRYRKLLAPRDIIALSSFPIFIFIAAVLQSIVYKISVWLFLLAAVSVFTIYLMIQADRNRKQEEQDRQLVDMNIAMMLSQIQPHFLYNALSSIRRMIKKDPEVAEIAVENFSTYLRQNLEALNRVDPISFTAELKHVEEYLYLEKLRFGERLRVEHSIGFTEFALPPLTLQPIVENAVKHGIMKKETGGCIYISTQREGKCAVLTVRDDGVGFIPDTVLKGDRMHVGFTNVERRIQMQCNGALHVQSKIGIGTTVTITIPLI